MEQQKMVKVSVEVRSGYARFKVGVQAESIRRALSIVGGRYPQGEIRVVFPAEPAGFLVRQLSVPAEMASLEQASTQAA